MTNQAADRPPVDMDAFHAACAAATADAEQPVWAYEPFWRNNSRIRINHYVHTSRTNPALIAYTQSLEKGLLGISTPIKPGRYLTKFFSDVLSEKQIAFYAAWQSTGSQGSEWADADRYPMAFASDGADIVSVYERGPNSCMKGMDCVRVYGAGDLAIAYITAGEDTGGRVLARALVWPDKKVIGRVYPNGSHWDVEGFLCETASEACGQALVARLLAAGYHTDTTNRGFNGARLTREDTGAGGYAMPYLDHSYKVADAGCYFLMDRGGDLSAGSTPGTMRMNPEEEEDDRAVCERCENRMDDDEEGAAVSVGWTSRRGAHGMRDWCERCVEDHTFFCEGSETIFEDSVDRICIDDTHYNLAWAEHAGAYECGHTNEWYFPTMDPSVTMANGDTWSPEAFRIDGFVCAITGGNYSRDDAHPDLHTVCKDVTDEAITLHTRFATIIDTNQMEIAV